jgi:hypothetical protein
MQRFLKKLSSLNRMYLVDKLNAGSFVKNWFEHDNRAIWQR